MHALRLILLLTALFTASIQLASAAQQPADIVFLSDFGLQDDAVSQCKAAIYNIFPQARITDMTHNVPPYNIAIASFLLADAAKIWPPGTVFLAVVDPGVGSSRKMLALRTKTGHIFVGPDNGLFTYPIRNLGLAAAVALENAFFFRTIPAPMAEQPPIPQISSTFHGRDIFAPVAAHLAKTPAVFPRLGRPVASPVMTSTASFPEPSATSKQANKVPPPASHAAEISPDFVSGEIIYTEAPFGNVWTNIEAKTINSAGIIPGAIVQIEIAEKNIAMPFVTSFSKVPPGTPLAYVNSRGLFSLALNMDDFSKRFSVKAKDPVKVRLSDRDLVDVMAMSDGLLGFDIRYATTDNFTGKKVYPEARCYLRRDAANALLKAAVQARSMSSRQFGICVHDCYRPLSVQKIFWSIMPDERYVADPAKGSRHNRAMAVDVYPCDYSGKPLPAPTPYDDFSEKAHRNYTGAGKEATENSRLLETLMNEAGYQGLATEWWHYDYKGWETAPVLDTPFYKD